MESLNNQKENLKQSVKKWNSEKSANEEYIAQVELEEYNSTAKPTKGTKKWKIICS